MTGLGLEAAVPVEARQKFLNAGIIKAAGIIIGLNVVLRLSLFSNPRGEFVDCRRCGWYAG